MTQKNVVGKKRKAKKDSNNHAKVPRHEPVHEENEIRQLLPGKKVKENEHVAVAYQDAWYPGLVTSVKKL